MSRPSTHGIATILGNGPIAVAVGRSIRSALKYPFVHLDGGKTVPAVFRRSLKVAIRNIESHPRGKLFRRLIEYGPHNPDEPEALTSDGRTSLSDPECSECVEFIFSHMVNRFKGELAELLAIEPCIELVQQLTANGCLPSDVHLYWGDAVHERRNMGAKGKRKKRRWSHFVKGADGLLIEHSGASQTPPDPLKVHGVVEVKSMALSDSRVVKQIGTHIARLGGGLKLGEQEWAADRVNRSVGVRIMVRPSTWKLSREWLWRKTHSGRAIVFPEKAAAPVPTQIVGVDSGLWAITLDWSEEAIEEAAYNMTFWYMGQVGEHVYTKTPLPNDWQEMTAEQGGYNAIKMMLYYIMLRCISKRHDRLATKLYNVYCFGYPLGVDSRKMLWPDDFSESCSLGVK